jgi:hypothetical protein
MPETTTEAKTEIADAASLRTALVELLTKGQHHDAATPAVLAAVGQERREREAQRDQWTREGDHHHLATLTTRLGEVAHLLTAAVHDDTTRSPRAWLAVLRTNLTRLSADTLAWLDNLAARVGEGEPTDEPPF